MDFYYEIKKKRCIEIDGKRIPLFKLGFFDLSVYYEFEKNDDLVTVEDYNGLYGVINMNGKEIVPCSYHAIACFCDGYARVENFHKTNFIDKDGNLLFSHWLNTCCRDVGNFHGDYAIVRINDDKINIIDKQGNFLLDESRLISKSKYNCVFDIYDGKIRVEDNGRWNFFNKEGNLLFEEWLNYDVVYDFHEGYALVKNNEQFNFIDEDGKLLFKEWLAYDLVYDFHEGYAKVWCDKKCNFIDKTGKLLLNKWLERSSHFREGKARVEKNGRYNYIDKNGNLLSDEWIEKLGIDSIPLREIIQNNRNEMKSVEFNDKEYPTILLETTVKISLDSDSKEYVFTDEQQEEKALMVVDYFLDTIERINESKAEFFAKKLVK